MLLRRTKGRRVRRRSLRTRRPPPEGLSVVELAARVGVTPRAVRYYVQRGVLPPPEFHGRRTRYDRDHVARLFAIVAMQKERLDLNAIRRRLTTLSRVDLETYLPRPPAPAEATVAPAPTPTLTQAIARWEHVTLLPGVELHVRADVSPAVRKIAQEIVDAWTPP